MKLTNIAFFFIMIFSVFGFIVFFCLIHELSHWQDFKEVVVEDRICFRVSNFSLFGEESDGAIYSFFPKVGTSEEVKRIDKYTEYKAYAIDSFFLVLFAIGFCLVFWRWLNSEVSQTTKGS